MFLKGNPSSGSARKMFEDKRWTIAGKPIVVVNNKTKQKQTASAFKNKRNGPPDAEKVSAPSIIENVKITNKLLKISLENTNKQNKLLQEIVDSLDNKKTSGSSLLPTLSTIGKMVSSLGRAIGRVIGGLIRQYIKPLIAFAARYIAKGFRYFGRGISKGVRYLGRGISKFVRNGSSNFYNKSKNIFKKTLTNTKEIYKKTLTNAKEIYKKYLPKAKEFITNSYKSGLSSFKQFVEKMRTPKLPPLRPGYTFENGKYRGPDKRFTSEANARGITREELKNIKDTIVKTQPSTLFKPEPLINQSEKVVPKSTIKSFFEKFIPNIETSNNIASKIAGKTLGVLGSKIVGRLLFVWSLIEPSEMGKDEDILSIKTKLDILNEEMTNLEKTITELQKRNKESGGYGINYATEIAQKKNRIKQLNDQILKEQQRINRINGFPENHIPPTPEMNNGLFGRISYDQRPLFNKTQYSKIIFKASSIKFISDKFTFNKNKGYSSGNSNYNSGGITNASYSSQSPSSQSSSSSSSSTYTTQEGDIVKVIEAGPGFNVVQFDDGRIERRVGDRSWRNNNPGNLDYGAYARSKGAIASDGKSAIFPNMDAGRTAHQNILWELGLYRGKTIEQAINIYAPPFENDTESYIRRICAAAGVSRNMLLSEMSNEQRQKMIAAMEVIEGNTNSGKITVIKPGETINKPVVASLQRSISLASASSEYSDQKQNINNSSFSIPIPIPIQSQQKQQTILANADYEDSVSLSELIKSQTMAA
jgi:hypothetical protein